MKREEIVAERLRRNWAFVLVPSVVVRDTQLSDQERTTYEYLVDHSGSKMHCWISQKKLAESRNKSLRTIERHISKLKQCGLIQVEHKGRYSDTFLTDVSLLYQNPKVRYRTSVRIPVVEEESGPDINGGSETTLDPTRMAGLRPDINGGQNIEKGKEEEKPDPSDLGGCPSGTPPREENQESAFDSPAMVTVHQDGFPEVLEMALTPSRHAPATGFPCARKSPAPGGKEEVRTVSPDGFEVGKRKKEKKTSPTKAKVNEFWQEWKSVVKSRFGIPLPGGPVPTGQSFGHLKNLLSFFGYDYEYAVEIMRKLLEEWETIQKRVPMASQHHAPTLYILDTLKEELHTCRQLGKKFGETGVEAKKDAAVFGVDRHAKKEWTTWKKYEIRGPKT